MKEEKFDYKNFKKDNKKDNDNNFKKDNDNNFKKDYDYNHNFKNLEDYLNSIDFSILDFDSINNIYKEIFSVENAVNKLCCSQYATNSFEKLVEISSIEHLEKLVKKIDFENIPYKKLGSRIIERIFIKAFEFLSKNVYENVYECENFNVKNSKINSNVKNSKIDYNVENGNASVYKHSNNISNIYNINSDYLKNFTHFLINFLNIKKFIKNQNASYILRRAINLITGKQVENNKIIKKYSFKFNLIDQWKSVFKEIILSKKITEDFSFGTILLFLQCTKSQSLIKLAISLEKKDYFLEGLCLISNKENLNNLYYQYFDKNFKCINEKSIKCINEKNFVNIKNQIYSLERFTCALLKRIDKNMFFIYEENLSENILLSLLINQIKNKNFHKIKFLIKQLKNDIIDDLIHDTNDLKHNLTLKKYNTNYLIHKKDLKHNLNLDIKENDLKLHYNLLNSLLLDKYQSIDTKYVQLATLLMSVPSKYNFKINEEYFANFQRFESKSEIELLIGFLKGSASRLLKEEFIKKNFDKILFKLKKLKEDKMKLKKLLMEYIQKENIYLKKKISTN